MHKTHVMLFDLYAGGHRGQYIQQLVSYWGTSELQGQLDIVVPSHFLEIHVPLSELADRHRVAGVHLIPIREPVHVDTERPLGQIRSDLEHGRLLRQYIKALRPDHCLLMYFDHIQLSLALDLRFDLSVRFSGIYFRPTAHYRYLPAVPTDVKEKLRDLRKVLLLFAALRNPHFENLFCLDPFAVPHLQRLHPSIRAVPLPDGIEPCAVPRPPAEIRSELGVETSRKMLLLFGSLAQRKGTFKLLEAMHRLSVRQASSVSLVLAGAVPPAERDPLRREIATLRQNRPVQVILHDAFVPDEELQDLFRAADLALLPYQRHVGSSGVLIRAAAEQVPVLGPSYGLLGEYIRRRRLGMAVDTTSPDAIAQALMTFLDQPGPLPFDAEEARRFASENTAEQFATTIFQHLGVHAADAPVPAEHGPKNGGLDG